MTLLKIIFAIIIVNIMIKIGAQTLLKCGYKRYLDRKYKDLEK